MSKKHPCQTIEFKPNQFAEVDIKMIPLVLWMNKLDGLTTQYCCQGTAHRKENDKIMGRPYILFVCDNDTTLGFVTRKLREYIERMEFSELNGEWRYTFRLHNTKALKRMNQEMFDDAV